MQRELAHYYADGRGLAKNPGQALAWFLRAAEQGDAKAQYEVARCYQLGVGTPPDPVLAFTWFGKAAAVDHCAWDVPYELGRCYEEGLGTAPDRDEAIHWYRAGAKRNHREAWQRFAALDPEQARTAREEWDDG